MHNLRTSLVQLPDPKWSKGAKASFYASEAFGGHELAQGRKVGPVHHAAFCWRPSSSPLSYRLISCLTLYELRTSQLSGRNLHFSWLY